MSLIPVAVGHARERYGVKYIVAVNKTNAGGQGWTHEFSFQAYNIPVANTVPVGKISSMSQRFLGHRKPLRVWTFFSAN